MGFEDRGREKKKGKIKKRLWEDNEGFWDVF